LRVRLDSLNALRAWIRADLARYDRPPIPTLIIEPQTRWQLRLRVTEYLINRGLRPLVPLVPLARWRLQAGAVRLGYTIPPNVCGPGLKLPHWGTIVVSSEARIGPGCTLHPNTMIGVRAGAPRVGSNVTICAGACIEGPITIGDRAYIAPNAVVRADVRPSDVVGGVPARSLHPERFVTSGDIAT
jgi:serine O-acetyltransferase